MPEADDRPSTIRTVDVVFDGIIHRVPYYIEHGIIHAVVGDRPITAPVGFGKKSASVIVVSLVAGHLQAKKRRLAQAASWGRRIT
jgi:hypothetical protein